ncbi:MAG TPA: hypothetical protein VN698_00700 [Bacteroidia bacterium]|nr:hypothetical protein [Bacteroidia bacterium]
MILEKEQAGVKREENINELTQYISDKFLFNLETLENEITRLKESLALTEATIFLN